MAVTSLLSAGAHEIQSAKLVARKGQVYIPAALSGNVTLGDTYPNICKFDTGGAHRDVTLDALATSEGLYRRIVNGAGAAENLVVKNPAGSTIGTINQNEQGEFYCDGAAWYLIAITTIALS